MKRRLVSMLMVGMMVTGMATGCGSEAEITDTQVPEAASIAQTEGSEAVESDAANKVEVPQTEIPAENFKTKVLEDGTIEIDSYDGDYEAIVIPAQIGGRDVTVIGGFANEDEITSVVIPDTVREISNKAFLNCYDITFVKMGANVEVIGDYAFDGDFEEIVLPNTLKVIGENAFAGVPLKVLSIPNHVEEIGGGAFLSADIEKLTIPGSVKLIGYQAFLYCNKLETVVIEEGVETIENEVFRDCTSLKTITIPSSVTSMGESTFSECKDVTIIAEPGSYAEEFANRKKIPVQNP
ncbi:MAG: leucine-rich repeat domain-containing protein [Lachnospiraceae bacterium]|nr:leucine-rich repeat domain-containing protein [Lachnospiraceae bacterium]